MRFYCYGCGSIFSFFVFRKPNRAQAIECALVQEDMQMGMLTGCCSMFVINPGELRGQWQGGEAGPQIDHLQ